MMERLAINNEILSAVIYIRKNSILDVWQGSENTSEIRTLYLSYETSK